jgi:hypothetical protein
MRGPKHHLGPALVVAVIGLLLAPTAALAYVGPGPGLEFIPTFLSLLTWVGLATGAVLWWPVSALIRRMRGNRRQPANPAEPSTDDAQRTAESQR